MIDPNNDEILRRMMALSEVSETPEKLVGLYEQVQKVYHRGGFQGPLSPDLCALLVVLTDQAPDESMLPPPPAGRTDWTKVQLGTHVEATWNDRPPKVGLFAGRTSMGTLEIHFPDESEVRECNAFDCRIVDREPDIDWSKVEHGTKVIVKIKGESQDAIFVRPGKRKNVEVRMPNGDTCLVSSSNVRLGEQVKALAVI